jgi:hypothetical protein
MVSTKPGAGQFLLAAAIVLLPVSAMAGGEQTLIYGKWCNDKGSILFEKDAVSIGVDTINNVIRYKVNIDNSFIPGVDSIDVSMHGSLDHEKESTVRVTFPRKNFIKVHVIGSNSGRDPEFKKSVRLIWKTCYPEMQALCACSRKSEMGQLGPPTVSSRTTASPQ